MSKFHILDYLNIAGHLTAFDLAAAFEVPYPAAAMALLRLTRQGLLSRHFDLDQYLYVYTLTQQGLARLDYFVSLYNDQE